MIVLLAARSSPTNQYLDLLASAYQACGIQVIFDVHNFLYSDVIPDFVHIQWPEAIYGWPLNLPKDEVTLSLLRNRLNFYMRAGSTIVYTAHNLLPHRHVTEFDRDAYGAVLSSADIIVHHGTATIQTVLREFPESSRAKHVVCPHGPYPYAYHDPHCARQKYDLPNHLYSFLNFGRQFAYKGTDFIRRVFDTLHDAPVLLFTIGPETGQAAKAGTGSASKKNTWLTRTSLRRLQKIFPTKRVQPSRNIHRVISSDEIPRIMAASDVVFLGHMKAFNSGLLALAASYGKPVVCPDIGNFKEQLRGWPWQETYLPGSENSAGEAVMKLLDKIKQFSPGGMLFDNSAWLESHSWERHVEIIVAAVHNHKNIFNHV